ncbi:MAG: precorrin-6A reductase [Firmicutes bacterium]|nr:precorrin-6A reductase [Bacillota bacterium]
MSDKICVFAGTRDGRELAELMASAGLDVTACAATEYGGELLEGSEKLKVRTGRMEEDEMEAFLKGEGFSLVIDATHPYAALVTKNIRAAAEKAGAEYQRLIRAQGSIPGEAVYVEDTAEAVEYLKGVEGNVLLTTGSKELQAYSAVPGFGERFWARVLPLESSLRQAEEAGLPAGRIIAMQGPFTREINAAMLRMTGARYMVTKMSGSIGGFTEKMEAAEDCGVTSVVVGRPPEEDGVDFCEFMALLKERYGLETERCITIAGIGMGTMRSMTDEVRQAIIDSDCLIGAGRMLDTAAEYGKPSFKAIAPEAIRDAIVQHPEYAKVCVLMSGDTGFFSGTKKLAPLLKESGMKVTILPGLSSMSYLAAKTGESYDDAKMVSLHGRTGNIAADVRNSTKVLCLVGGEDGTSELINTLVRSGLGDVTVYVGERLGYDDEKITSGRAAELAGKDFDSLSAVMIVNPAAGTGLRFGFPDKAFIRGGDAEGVVPMTKSEVRAAVLSKLQLNDHSDCWDIGAGTGSVSIEMALNAPYGTTYAIEKKEKALELLRENVVKFCAGNVEVVPGTAPEALEGLPSPTHVFIGGSSGNMKEILDLILMKNTNARIVACAVSLETVGELAGLIKNYDFDDKEVVCLNVARAREIGNYNLMTGQNPIYIFTMQKLPAEAAGVTLETGEDGRC